MEFKDKIKLLRLERGFTQKHMAERSDINLRTYQKYESGEIPPLSKTVRRISDALNSDLAYLLDISESGNHVIEVRKTLSEYSNGELLAEIKRRMEG